MALFIRRFSKLMSKKSFSKGTRRTSSNQRPRGLATIVVSMVIILLIVPMNIGKKMMTTTTTTTTTTITITTTTTTTRTRTRRRRRRTTRKTRTTRRKSMVRHTLARSGTPMMRALTPIVMIWPP
jgi:hypothetical protein